MSNINFNTPFKTIILKNWNRILLPYISWTIIFLLLLFIKSTFFHSNSNIVFWKAIFYGNSAMHLYFLPMLFALQLLALSLLYIFKPKYNNQLLGIIIMCCVLLYLSIGLLFDIFGLIKPLHIISYLLFAFWAMPKINNVKFKIQYVLLGFVFLIITFYVNWSNEESIIIRSIKLFPLGGISLVLISMGMPLNKAPKWIIYLSSLSYGIYLSHVVFLEIFELIIEKMTHGKFMVNIPMELLIVILIFIFSATFTLIARKIPITRKLLIGEK